MESDNGQNGQDEEYRNELFRLNCVEIASEEVDNEYSEHPISLVDNVLSEDEEEEYIDYVCFGRNGMPNWKAYYDIKNLVETLEDIDGLENKNVRNILKTIEDSFLMMLFSKIGLEDKKISNPFKTDIFNILRKLEFFYPKDEGLLTFILKVDKGRITNKDASVALSQHSGILKDENYFLDGEKALMEIMIYHFVPDVEIFSKDKFKGLISDEDIEQLISFLDAVKVSG